MKDSFKFSGSIDLSDPTGTLYDIHNQSGELIISVNSPISKGWALVIIVADGSAITLPSTWILYGGDAISTVSGDENHLQVFCKTKDTVYYTNKVV